MNYIKLNELAAQAMGWVPYLIDGWQGGAPDFVKIKFREDWNPCGDLNDASALLEKVADKRRWEIKSYEKFDDDKRTYFHVRIVNHMSGPKIKKTKFHHESQPVAITLCALRASGIPESSITEATGG